MVDVVTLKASGLNVLDALGTYRFLTAEQMVRVGASPSTSTLYPLLKELSAKPRPYIGKLDFGVLPGHGRLANIHHLTARGGEVLADSGRDAESIAVPKRVRFFAQDYFHRVQCVDMHIALTQALPRAEMSLVDYATYYAHGTKTSPDTFAAKTTVKWPGGQLTADAVFRVAGSDSLERLCFLELHRGDDLRRIKSQFQVYVTAIAREALELAFEYRHAARVLLVFEDANAIDRFLTWASTIRIDQGTAGRFFITSLVQYVADPLRGWRRLPSLNSEQPSDLLFPIIR